MSERCAALSHVRKAPRLSCVTPAQVSSAHCQEGSIVATPVGFCSPSEGAAEARRVQAPRATALLGAKCAQVKVPTQGRAEECGLHVPRFSGEHLLCDR